VGYWLMAILLLFVWFSLWLRMRGYRVKNGGDIEPRMTPLSMAVQELVATSGGIYLAIIALTSFLKLDMPERITILQATVDPLALGAITLALVQPLVAIIAKKLIGR